MQKKINRMAYFFYGLGVAYFMLDQVFNQWVKYYYLPPETAIVKYGMSAIIPNVLLTIAFIIMRFVDAIADPVVGYMSDNSKSKFGRRSIYMLIGIFPLALSMIGFFYPLGSTNLGIMTYIAFVGSIYFVAYTFVGGPYNALIPDLANNKEERLALSTVQSIFRLLFTAIPLILSPILIGKLYTLKKISYVTSLRYVIIGFAVVGTILVLISIFFLNERKIGKKIENNQNKSFKSYIKYLKNKEIYLYFLGFFLFFAGFNIVRNSVIYYVTLVLGKSEADSFKPTALLFLISAIFFPVTKKLCEKYDYRKVMLLDLILIVFGTLGLILFGSINEYIVYLMFAIIGVGVSGAAFIFPPAMLSEITNSLYEKYNISVEGVMFGIQGLFLKLALLFELVITTLILPFGSINGGATKEGLLISLFVAVILLALSFVCYFLKKNEI